MMNNAGAIRFCYLLGFILIASLFCTAIYLQIHEGVIPCPLCLLQRFILGILGILFFLGALFPFKKIIHVFIGILGTLVALSGILFSGRQVWLQHMPSDDTGGCGVSLEFLYQMYPLTDVIAHVWQGGMECSQYTWTFLGLSLAEWSLWWFVVFFFIVIAQLKRSLAK